MTLKKLRQEYQEGRDAGVDRDSTDRDALHVIPKGPRCANRSSTMDNEDVCRVSMGRDCTTPKHNIRRRRRMRRNLEVPQGTVYDYNACGTSRAFITERADSPPASDHATKAAMGVLVHPNYSDEPGGTAWQRHAPFPAYEHRGDLRTSTHQLGEDAGQTIP